MWHQSHHSNHTRYILTSDYPLTDDFFEPVEGHSSKTPWCLFVVSNTSIAADQLQVFTSDAVDNPRMLRSGCIQSISALP